MRLGSQNKSRRDAGAPGIGPLRRSPQPALRLVRSDRDPKSGMASAKDIENRKPITAALMLATLMNTLDSTIANVALPHIQGSVSAAQDQITWVLTSYIIATGLMTPLSGWLAQKIRRKPMFLYSIVRFTVASMLCRIA